MRRPVKPFVTEYKSPNRKSKDLFDMTPMAESFEPAPQIAPEGARKPFSSEDSYEAAMRAADALFGTSAPTASADEPAPRPTEHQGGRVLRAIEPEEDNRFAALEAERAPKRRGRKPGSKNRPKLPIAAIEVATVSAPRAAKAPEARRTAILAPPRPLGTPRERFAWVRTTLRPGEKWKRRLPKVAW